MAIDLGMGVDRKVSPAFHPQSVAGLEEYDADTEGHLKQVVDVFTATYQSVSDLVAARDAARDDPSLTDAAQVLRVADHADKLVKTATERLTKAASAMRSGIALIEKQLTGPVESKAADSISAEIRAHIRGVKSPMDFVRNAIMRGDNVTVSAALGSPYYLTNLTPEMKDALLRIYHEQSDPLSAKRQRAMQKALEMITDRAALLQKEVDRAVGSPAHVVRQYREAKVRADRAFAR